jgi:hypothetical protein
MKLTTSVCPVCRNILVNGICPACEQRRRIKAGLSKWRRGDWAAPDVFERPSGALGPGPAGGQ